VGSIMTSEEVCKAVEGERFDGFGLGREGKVRKTGGGREGRGGGGERRTSAKEGRRDGEGRRRGQLHRRRTSWDRWNSRPTSKVI